MDGAPGDGDARVPSGSLEDSGSVGEAGEAAGEGKPGEQEGGDCEGTRGRPSETEVGFDGASGDSDVVVTGVLGRCSLAGRLRHTPRFPVGAPHSFVASVVVTS